MCEKCQLTNEGCHKILEFNDKPLLVGKGEISNAMMEKKVREIYQLFDQKRKSYDAKQADLDDLEKLKQLLGLLK